MLLTLAALLTALLTLIGVCSTKDIPVISGVFMPQNITVDYEGAKAACGLQYSRLATLQEITAAYKNGYEYCKWGWIEEKRIAMLRLTPFLPCARHNLGILIRDCPNIRAAWCADDTGAVSGVPIPWSFVPSYENATLICRVRDLSLATYEQIKQWIQAGNALQEGFAWYDSGVGQVLNESGSLSFKSHVCNDVASKASAFCYNPSLADHIIVDNTQTVKKIIIACLLISIFVLLLFAAFFMKGNKFICCLEKQQPQSPGVVQAPLSNWNMASVHRRASQANREVEYGKVIRSEMRPPAIHPEMSHYRSHYTNMGYEASGDD